MKKRYTKADLEEIVSKQLENLISKNKFQKMLYNANEIWL